MKISLFIADFDNDQAEVKHFNSKEEFIDWTYEFYFIDEEDDDAPQPKHYWSLNRVVQELNDWTDESREITIINPDEDIFVEFEKREITYSKKEDK